MKTFVNSFKTFLLVAVLALFVQNSSALVLTSTDTTPWSTLNDSSQFVTLNQFNPTFGNLTDVEFVLSSQLRGTANFVSFWFSQTPFNVNSYSVQANVSAILNTPFATTLTTVSSVQLAPPSFSIPANSGTVFHYAAGSTNSYFYSIPPYNLSDFAAFVGTGTTNVSISAILSALSSTSGSGGVDLIAESQTTVTVNYHYEQSVPAVPETSTAISAGVFALIGSFFVLRKNKSVTLSK